MQDAKAAEKAAAKAKAALKAAEREAKKNAGETDKQKKAKADAEAKKVGAPCRQASSLHMCWLPCHTTLTYNIGKNMLGLRRV